MIAIEVQRARHGRTIKIYGRNEEQPPVTVTVRVADMHIYSHADMTHEDWTTLSLHVTQAIDEIKKRNGKDKDDETPSL